MGDLFPGWNQPQLSSPPGLAQVARLGKQVRLLAFRIDPMYSAQLLDHFQNPRNAGELPDADAAAEIQNPVCGDVIRLTLKIRGDRIEEIRFKAKGCVPAIACGSALTELTLGKPAPEARRIKRDDLIAAVGGLPPASTHAAQLALDALSSALAQIETSPRHNTAQGS
jgi:nitrogen fixation protein NifU and related proteins